MSKEKQNEINILDVLVTIAKHKFFIFKMVFSITLVALIISLIWPHSYKSSGTFIPATQQRTLPGGIGGLLGSTMQLPMDFPQVNSEVMITILRGRELREDVISRFNFQEIYNTDIMEHLLLKLNESIDIAENREGGFGFNPIHSIELSFTSNDPELSYEVTRYILDQLDMKVRDINMDNSLEQLNIIEERFNRNIEELKTAEDTLLAFQEKYGIIQVRDQAAEIISQLASLKAASIETEMKIAVLSHSVGPDNSELRNLQRAKAEYDRQFETMMQKSDAQTLPVTGFYPLLDLPELGIIYFRLYRDVEIQAKIMEAIYPQYESQKMVVEANRRGIQIIDQPVIPTYKDGPKRAFIVLGGMFFSIFLAFSIIFFREMIEKGRREGTENYRKIQELREQMRFRSSNKGASPSES